MFWSCIGVCWSQNTVGLRYLWPPLSTPKKMVATLSSMAHKIVQRILKKKMLLPNFNLFVASVYSK